MKQAYLGDSYDIVKRFWAESLRSIAPLYAHARFIPHTLRATYTAMTAIPVFDPSHEKPDTQFGVLLDPDTGVPLPSEVASTTATVGHTPLNFIIRVFEEYSPLYLICFDQSYHRMEGFDRKSQRAKKIAYLVERDLSAFYYVSHAPFLFVARNSKSLDTIRLRLLHLGIPESRLEGRNLQSNPE